MTATFTCADCADAYQLHWRDPNTGLCLTCAGRIAGICRWQDGHPQHLSEHPCSFGPHEGPGDPCRYCGAPVPETGPCKACWVSLDGMPLADVKALFAADGTFNIGGLGPAGGQP